MHTWNKWDISIYEKNGITDSIDEEIAENRFNKLSM